MLDDNRDLCLSPHRFSAVAVSIGQGGGRAFGTKDRTAWGLGRLWGGAGRGGQAQAVINPPVGCTVPKAITPKAAIYSATLTLTPSRNIVSYMIVGRHIVLRAPAYRGLAKTLVDPGALGSATTDISTRKTHETG